MNLVYSRMNNFVNFFQPSMKLDYKERIDGSDIEALSGGQNTKQGYKTLNCPRQTDSAVKAPLLQLSDVFVQRLLKQIFPQKPDMRYEPLGFARKNSLIIFFLAVVSVFALLPLTQKWAVGIALLLGSAVSNLVPAAAPAGLGKMRKLALNTAVVLFGFGMNIRQVVAVGGRVSGKQP
ncbi:MAG: hypothetical protein Q7I97_02055 [Thermovirgaceae bacterium]|nr:hypothetical protein [Thermovirgaceae bacterium]